jgi:hypothetical protein
VSWLAAFSMCTSIDVFRHDLYYRLYELADAFGITEEELEAAKDPSTTRYYYPSSEIAKW